jgi:hypothetical protein
VVWFYERQGCFVRFETQAGTSGRWELVVIGADGTERVERFEDDLALQARQRQLEMEFRSEGWDGPHGRFT